MAELREFVQHKKDFDANNIQLVAISNDDPEHAKKVYEGPAAKDWTILMDPGFKTGDAYGVKQGDSVARTVVLIDENGQEIFRQSTSGIDESKLPDQVITAAKGKS
ncbi:MAG TPA: redoxin domain-containing protein [Terriglobales bacterium]|jgi:peroxiredoxin